MIRTEPSKSPRERVVARLMERTVSDLSMLPEEIERDARAIADAMASLHGGEWSIQIDHEAGFVLVRLR
ncbi:hypothetical protein GCM10011385_00020 [Nitratireductor aestuarii]|uniref:Uncharacterized protein n=1 Tax=Nitratireductor aestuarii TaxID=1735103 RepID=A0A916RBL2_9HYPH|nr:hypothetical protein GCM10011385_00020 [Nitratireductor aestuarii]